MPVGPQLPSSLAEKRKRSPSDDESDSDNGVGPSLPQKESSPKRTRVIGPSLPPDVPERIKPAPVTNESNSDSESSDDDGFGPSLPPPNGSAASSANTTTFQAPAASVPTVSQMKRDDWMVVPPTSGDWSSRMDPTKLKSRKFNSGKGAKGPSQASASGGDTWHETPAEKQARLQREVLGIKDKPSSATANVDGKPRADLDAATAKKLQEYNKSRGPTLYEAHQKTSAVEQEDDPSARAFDREKDIGGGLQINSTQRREMMKKASDFSSRFSSAKYL